MSVYERNQVLHYRFMIQGRRYSASTGLLATKRNLKVAQEMELEARTRARAGRVRRRAVGFAEAANQFLASVERELRPESVRRLRTSMAVLRRQFETALLHLLTPSDIEDFKSVRRSEGIEEVTIRHDLHALSRLLQYGRLQRWLESDPLDGVAIPSDRDSVREKVVSQKEERAYFEAAAASKSLCNDVAKLILLTGMRVGEVYRLEWRDLDVETGRLRVRRSKSRAGQRTLRLVAEARSLLASRLALRVTDRSICPFVFESPRHPGKPLTRLTVSHKKICARAGVDFWLEDLRTTFGTRMAQAGCPPHDLMKIMGHSSLAVTMRHYVHAQPEDVARAFDLYEAAMRKDDTTVQ